MQQKARNSYQISLTGCCVLFAALYYVLHVVSVVWLPD